VNKRISSFLTFLFISQVTFHPPILFAWSNGPPGNAWTDQPSECATPSYSTHDWIADHALDLLPDTEKNWLTPHRALYILGTEAPDNDGIPSDCNGPNNGYDDRNRGHSVEWNSDWSMMVRDRAARRAQEEYDKAALAYDQGNQAAAAFYLGHGPLCWRCEPIWAYGAI